ncbi:MAG: site-specific integrase, partial [Planctomycetes bacterium]|nr:site-specific integrase [Planctomycetota bacterium]
MNNVVLSSINVPVAHDRIPALLELFLSGKSPKTIEAYSADLNDFACYLSVQEVGDAARLLLSREAGAANEMVLGYRNSLLARELSSATVNRRLASVRSLVKLGQMLGIVGWSLSVPGVRQKRQRNMSGPS